MDDWGGLENRCGLTATVGSNPTPSALKRSHKLRFYFSASGEHLFARLRQIPYHNRTDARKRNYRPKRENCLWNSAWSN